MRIKLKNSAFTELTLSNGVKVILKPTDFKNDEIRFKAFSPGGTSLYSDADFESASSAAGLVESMGLGQFSPTDLEKMLSGKIVGVGSYISERSEGVEGSSSPKGSRNGDAADLSLFYFAQKRQFFI